MSLPFRSLALRIGVPLAMGAVTIALCYAAPVTSQMSPPGVNLELPVFVGDFMGMAQEISIGEQMLLPEDTGIVRRHYSALDGAQIIASIVLAGEDARSIHRPEICLPAQGWKIKGARVIRVPVGDAQRPTELMALTLARPVQLGDGRTIEQQALYAYTFVGENKTTAHHWERIFLTSYDRLFHGQNHRWAYVAFLVPMPIDPKTGRSAEEPARAILETFLRESGSTFIPLGKQS